MMETIHVRQAVRPVRYAFALDQDDLDAARRAVALNTALWGGIYNLLVPVDPDGRDEGILAVFDPDVVIDLTSSGIPARWADGFNFRILREDELLAEDQRTGEQRLRIGFSMLPVLQHLHDTEVRFLQGPSKAGIVTAEEASSWTHYVAFCFGSFAPLHASGLYPPASFTQMLRAQEVDFGDGEDIERFASLMSPIELTAYGIRAFGGFANFSSHIVFVGDHLSFADLVEYWNLRATGRMTWFVPIAMHEHHTPMIREVAEAGRYRLNPKVENHPNLQKGPSIADDAFEEAATSIRERGFPELVSRTWQARYGKVIPHYIGDIRVADLEAARGSEISIFDGTRATPVKVISPPYADEELVVTGNYRWSLEVAFSGGYGHNKWMFHFPRSVAVENIAAGSLGTLLGEARIGRRSIVIEQGGLEDTLFVTPVRTRKVFAALFREAGLEIAPSQPGRYLEQIIDKMGSLVFDCRVFKIRGVRNVVNQLGKGDKLTRGNMRGTILSTAAGEHGQNWRHDLYAGLHVRPGQAERLPSFEDIFEVLLRHRVVRPGYTFRCEQCYSESWYHVSQFTETYTCRYCFAEQPVPFGSKAQGRGWGYAADGMFQIPGGAMGSLAVIVTLWRLAMLDRTGMSRYLVSSEVTDASDEKREIDFAFVELDSLSTEYELLLGEAKGYSELAARDVEKLRELGERFRKPPFLAFSVLREALTAGEKKLLARLVKAGHRVIVLSRLELDPYELRTDFEGAPHRYVRTLAELSENSIALHL